MKKKTVLTTVSISGIILAIIILLPILIIVIGIGSLYYEIELKETKINEFTSDDGQYTLTMYQVGEPDFPFGAVSGKFELKKDDDVINTYDFRVMDDGCGLNGNVPAVRWTDTAVMLIVDGSEQKEQLYILNYDGTAEERQSYGWYTTEEIIALIKDTYGENVEYTDTVEPYDGIYIGNGPYREPTNGYHIFRVKTEEPKEGTFEFYVFENRGVLENNYIQAYFKYTTDCYVTEHDVAMEWRTYGDGAGENYIPCFNAQIDTPRQQMELCNMVCDYVEYCLEVKALQGANEWFERFDFSLNGKPGTLEPTMTVDEYDRTLFYNEVYQEVDHSLKYNLNIEGNGSGDEVVSEEVMADWLSREPACTFTMEDGMELRLVAVDRATGNDYYALIGTYDGQTCAFYNPDPYNGRGGLATGMMFVDEKVGFITISWGGEAEGAMYRTEDGGETFEPSFYPSPMVTDENGTYYNPFVVPDAVYEKDGLLYLEVSQGVNGSYHGEQGYCKALYSSDDLGFRWDYVGEIPVEN